MPNISIIVPVYGAENYLHPCLDSILAQTYVDWECILIDDGSKDKSGTICDEYSTRDNRFRVIHKENGGVSSARNVGIDESSGEWCCFIDSDDWIEESYLQNFIDSIEKTDELILQSYYKDIELSKRSTLISLPEKLITSASELVCFLDYTNAYNGYLWHRLFKRSIIKEFNIQFPIGVSFAEDGIFCLNYILHTQNFRLTNKAGYHHIIRPNTLTSTGKNLPVEKCFYLLDNYSSLICQIVEKEHPHLNIIRGLSLLMNRWIIKWLFGNIKSENDFYKLSSDIPIVTKEKICKNCNYMGGNMILSALFKQISFPPTFWRYKVFQYLVFLYKVEYWIKKKMFLYNRNL